MIKFYNNFENEEKFYNNFKNEEKFLAIVDCIKRIEDIDYEGDDTSDPLDEMNDFMDGVGGLLLQRDDICIYCWFSEIYDRWMNDCCNSLSVETINKSFEAALNGKHFYDVDNFLDGWDKDLVEYVLDRQEEFAILNDKDDYKKFLYKYEVTVKCPSGYYGCDLDLWRPYKRVEEVAAQLLKDSVELEYYEDYYEDDDGNFIDDEGNIIDVKQEAARYAEAFLMEIDYKDVNIKYYN